MFSDNYIVSDKYDLNTKQMVSTFSRMPWRYTYLYDKSYLPVLDETIVNKLNSFLNFRHLTSTEVMYDSKKIIVIEHKDTEIKSFEIKNVLSYDVVSSHIKKWNHFIHSIDCEDLNYCKERIDNLTDETDLRMTKIGSIKYDSLANFSGVTVIDETYNLSQYSDNQLLVKINQIPKDMKRNIRGIISLRPHSSSLSYRLVFNYVKGLFRNPNKNNIIEEVDISTEHRDYYINLLVERGILSEDDANFIRSLCVGKTQFDLEYVINEDGDLENIFVYHYRIRNFKDLTSV